MESGRDYRKTLGGESVATILAAKVVGVPAFLNGYASLPLVGGPMGQGMAPGTGLAFLAAGGVTSVPAAMAVWAFASGLLFQLWLGFAASL